MTEHRINLLQPVYSISADPGFAMVDGVASGDMHLALDATRTMVIKPGTPGEITCSKFAEINQCIVAADLLGDAVVWFSLIPNPQRPSLVLPGITELHKDNWVLLDQRLGGRPQRGRRAQLRRHRPRSTSSASYGGSLSTSTFSFEQQEITKVDCLEQPETPTTTSSTTTTARTAGARADRHPVSPRGRTGRLRRPTPPRRWSRRTPRRRPSPTALPGTDQRGGGGGRSRRWPVRRRR